MQIEHIGLWAADIERLRTFYVTYFGAQAQPHYVNERKRFQSYFLTFATGARLELMQRADVAVRADADPTQEITGLAHLAFAVGSPSAVDALTQRLVDDGYQRIDGPRRTGDGYYESVMLDPEGNRIEITA